MNNFKPFFAPFVIVLILALIAFFVGFQHGGWSPAWAYLDKFSIVLGVIAFIPLVYAVWVYIKFIRLEKRELDFIRTSPGTSPAVLIVDIGGFGICNEVEAYLRQLDTFKDFDFEANTFVVHRDEDNIQATDVDGIIKEVEEKQNMIRVKAADKVHLFVKAPMPVAMMVGEVMANRCTTIVYHKQRNKGYENWGTLHR